MPVVGFPDDDDELIAGRYRLLSKLNADGIGMAYLAWDKQASIPVAVNFLKENLLEDSKLVAFFRHGSRLLRGLCHPRIVPIVDDGDHAGLPFVAMRFLPGGSLSNRRLRDEKGKVTPNQPGMLHLWLPAVAEALDYVHSQGVVHRDVKPASIAFDAFWGAYLGNFGIATIVEESETFDKEHTLTATHIGIGTQEYMCPEQFTPKAVIDGRADQYALAAIVFEMLAGARPFTGTTAHLIVEVMTHPVPSLAAHQRGLPATLVKAVHRGLAKKPGERFTSCSEFATAVLADVPRIEDEHSVIRMLCRKCSCVLNLPLTAAGATTRCPKCQAYMVVAHDLAACWLTREAEILGVSPAVDDAKKPVFVKARCNHGLLPRGLAPFQSRSTPEATPCERTARSRLIRSYIWVVVAIGVAAVPATQVILRWMFPRMFGEVLPGFLEWIAPPWLQN